MVKGLYQIPLGTRMKILHSNVCWSSRVEILNKGFAYNKGIYLYRKGIRCADDIWDSNQQNFHTWERAQEKFRLTNSDQDDWE